MIIDDKIKKIVRDEFSKVRLVRKVEYSMTDIVLQVIKSWSIVTIFASLLLFCIASFNDTILPFEAIIILFCSWAILSLIFLVIDYFVTRKITYVFVEDEK